MNTNDQLDQDALRARIAVLERETDDLRCAVLNLAAAVSATAWSEARELLKHEAAAAD